MPMLCSHILCRCRVPTDLLPPAVLADALIQLTEAIDGNQLAPPFLPYELLGRLYRSRPVMHSLQVAVEQGPAAAAAAAEAAAHQAAAARDLWTLRIGGEGSPAAAAEQASAAGGASGSSSALAGGTAESEGAAAAAGSTLLLLPLQASSEPLAVLLQRLVGAVLSCLLRRAGAALDAASLRCDLACSLGFGEPDGMLLSSTEVDKVLASSVVPAGAFTMRMLTLNLLNLNADSTPPCPLEHAATSCCS